MNDNGQANGKSTDPSDPRTCSKCGCNDTEVIKTDYQPRHATNWRRRRCRNCGRTWRTFEKKVADSDGIGLKWPHIGANKPISED